MCILFKSTATVKITNEQWLRARFFFFKILILFYSLKNRSVTFRYPKIFFLNNKLQLPAAKILFKFV